MNRQPRQGLRILFYAFVALLLTTFALSLSGCAKKEPLQGAVITKVAGQVTVLTANGERRAIKESDLYTQAALLLPGVSLTVDRGARADLAFTTGLTLSVTECSRLTLDTARIVLDKGYSRVEIKLEQGGVFTRSPRLERNSHYSITTPTTVASVRGTEFLVNQGGGCNFPDRPESATLVREGAVGVRGATGGAEQNLSAGQKANVSGANVAVTNLTPTEESQLAQLSESLVGLTEEGRKRIEELLRDVEVNSLLYKEALAEEARGGVQAPVPAERTPAPATAPQSNAGQPAPTSSPAAEPAPTESAPAPAPASKPEEKVGEGADSAPML
jgi:hypothetical protein